MKASVAAQLLALNHQFYQGFAASFAATRQRLQPGVARLLKGLPSGLRLLDLGCGSGEVRRALVRRGYQGEYVGLDFSRELLGYARQGSPGGLVATFHQADLASPGWDAILGVAQFDVIMAFAVLHHLPGADLRCQVLRTACQRLFPGGHFFHSVWQFLNSQRLRSRIQPWERAGLSEADVDPGDYLLDWRRDGDGLRYVHHFTLEELQDLADETGFTTLETFYSDGEGGKLALYQTWSL